MAKRKVKQRARTRSEKIMLVLSIIIALSMILALFVAFAPSAARVNSPTAPGSSSLPVELEIARLAAPIFLAAVATMAGGASLG
jgi:hypothetical protein